MHHTLLSSKIASFNINVKYHTILIYIWVFFVFPSQHLWQPRATFLRKCPVMSHIYSSVVLLESTIKTRCLLSQQVHNAAMTYTCHKCKNWWQHLLSLGPSVLMSLKNLIDKTYAYVFNSVSRDMFNQVIAKVFFWGGDFICIRFNFVLFIELCFDNLGPFIYYHSTHQCRSEQKYLER